MKPGRGAVRPEAGNQHDAAQNPVAPQRRAAEEGVPIEWQVGDVILDLYEVMEVHRGGGMGLVYRVHHRGWNTELAVKSPRAEYFQTEQQKENFVRECEAWMELGLHPHIVSCHYVRTLGGIPRVFAEYIDGGSLRDWVADRRLYAGGPAQAIERILDIAIQTARGLRHAHECRMIHQDVKPANVLIMPDGTAKITDFGLARARGVTAESALGVSGRSILASYGGLTPAYCSPEQAALGAGGGAGMSADVLPKLTRRTDIWSWGVSVFEMLLGEPPCQHGQVAGESFEQYLEHADQLDLSLPRMSSGLAELLRHCFGTHEGDRPRDFGEVIVRLLEIHRSVCGKDYGRPERSAVELRADELNNRAVSMLDLGRKSEGEKYFKAALERDPRHLEASFNFGLDCWRAGKLTDIDLIGQLGEVSKTLGHDSCADHFLGLVHIERGDFESAIAALDRAAARDARSDVRATLSRAHALARDSVQCVVTLEGHTGTINSVALSPDGRWALSGSDDRTLRLWELSTGQCVRTLQGHRGIVRSVALSADRRWALSGGDDQTLRLWELSAGRCIHALEGHSGGGVYSVVLSADDRWALSGGGDQVLRLWELSTGQCVRTLQGHRGSINSVSLSADCRWALSGSDDETLPLWDLSVGRCVRIFEGYTGAVRSVGLSGDGRWVVSGGDDHTLRLWELSTGRCVRTFEGHSGGINSVSLSADGRWALSGGKDQTVRLWELSTGRCVRTFEGHSGGINSVSLSADGRWALSGGKDQTVRLWDLRALVGDRLRLESPARLCAVKTTEEAAEFSGRFEQLLARAESALLKARHADAGQYLSQARSIHGYERHDRALQDWNILLRCCARGGLRAVWSVGTFEAHGSSIASVALSADGRWALSGSDDQTLRLWDLSAGRCVRNFEGHTETVNSVVLSADGRWALSGSDDQTLRLWDLSAGRCVRTFEGHRCEVNAVSLSGDGRWALSGGGNATLRLWALATGRCALNFEGHRHDVNAVSVSADGQWALSGSSDGTVRVWELTTGRCLRALEEHGGSVISVGLSADCRWALSGCADDWISLWEVATGQCVRRFEGHSGGINSVSLSADGRWALSGGGDGTLRFWELSTGQCVRTLQGHRGGVNSIGLTADCRWALSGNGNGTLRLWELDWECEFPDPADWNEGAKPYLETFLILHCPVGKDGISRVGKPKWKDGDFARLIDDLQIRGYGWLRPQGVRRQLEKMTAEWQGPPPI